jgi:hypothetical protein
MQMMDLLEMGTIKKNYMSNPCIYKWVDTISPDETSQNRILKPNVINILLT